MNDTTKTPTTDRKLLLHALFWLAVCAALGVASHFARVGLDFKGLHPVPMRANPALLSGGVAAVVATLLLTLVAQSVFRRYAIPIAIAAIGATIASVGAILASLSPGTGSLTARDFLDPPEIPKGVHTFAVPVFFRNGRPKLDSQDIQRIQKELAVFRDCEASSVYVRGFASSAPFRNAKTPAESDEMNRQLANNRAVEAKKLLDNVTGATVRAVEWETYPDMTDARRLRDTSASGARLTKVESLNRRIEIFWNDRACDQAGASPSSM